MVITLRMSSESETEQDQGFGGVPKKKKIKREFQQQWLQRYKWLEYKDNKMTCKQCIAHNKHNTLTKGCSNFRHSTLQRHMSSKEHRDAIIATQSSISMENLIKKHLSAEDVAIIHALRTVYFLAKQDIASHKYPDFIDFLILQGCEGLRPLTKSGNATYKSHGIVSDMQDSITSVIWKQIEKKLSDSDFISLMIDESCDITVMKKLCIYARLVKDCVPETIFLQNVDIPDGTSATIVTKLSEVLSKLNVDVKKLVGFGSDGASVSQILRFRHFNPAMIYL